mgnify:CR=1 FL=1
MKQILPLLLIGLAACQQQKNQPPQPTEKKKQTILAILANPGDEHVLAPVLVKYARQSDVYVLFATDGALGTGDGIPTGDTLIRLRQEESRCAAAKMGYHFPIFLTFPDGMDSRHGLGLYMNQCNRLKDQLKQQVRDIGPDAILTFGPDGDDGHAGHRMISDIVTEIVLAENWVERYPLYYLGRTRKDDEKYARFAGVNFVAAAYLPVAVSYTQEDENKALDALRCNKSQFSADEVNRRIAVEEKDTGNTIRFRQLVVSTEKKTGF